MTRYEKVLLALLSLTLGLLLASVGSTDAFSWQVKLLSYSYLIGGYWLLQPVAQAGQPNSRSLVSSSLAIGSGICLGLGLLYFLAAIHLHAPATWRLVLLGGNVVVLGAYTERLRRAGNATRPLLPLLLRTVLVSGLGLLFTGRTVDTSFHRWWLLAFNRSDKCLASNVRMWEEVAQYEKATASDDASAALPHAQQAIYFGKTWLDADSVSERWKLGGIFQNLYRAYRDAGIAASEQGQFAQALAYYERGHLLLTTEVLGAAFRFETDSAWREDLVWSLSHLAYCHHKLDQPTLSDSLYVAAIKALQKVQPQPPHDLAYLLSDLAASWSERRLAAEANQLYTRANRILAQSPTTENRDRMVRNELRIALNYLALDSLVATKRILTSIRLTPADSDSRAARQITYAALLVKQSRYRQSSQAIRNCLPYYRSPARFSRSGLTTCLLLLANNDLALADYPSARAKCIQAQAALRLQEKLPSSRFTQAFALNLLGTISFNLADYQRAEAQLAQSLNLYPATPTTASDRADAFVRQAILLTHIGRYAEAQESLRQATHLASSTQLTPSQATSLMLEAELHAHAGHYSVAAAGYRRVLAAQRRYGQSTSTNTISALTGLLVTAIHRHQLALADSAYFAGLALCRQLLPDRHPLVLSLHLNASALRLHENNPIQAAELISQAQTLATGLLPPDHDFFGELALVQGDLAKAQHRPVEARRLYHTAYDLLLRKLGTAHPLVVQAKNKMPYKHYAN